MKHVSTLLTVDVHSLVGQTVSTYEVVEMLGEGGMGVVYKARDTRLARFVALKFLKPEGMTPDRKHRFFQEARSISGLNHPSIVHVHDLGEWNNLNYISMEFVDGTTLQDLLAAGRLSIQDALKFAIQIAEAVAAAHQAGIVHRDLKPGNIIVTDRRQIKVLDFGLAKLVETEPLIDDAPGSSETLIATQRVNYTTDGMLVGSVAYMSPEQALGQKVDSRSDIFAFGLVLYEMLAGVPAFPGSKVETLASIIYAEPKSLSTLAPAVSPELEWIVARCLRKDPGRRFQAISEVCAALEDLRTESSSAISRTSVLAPVMTAPGSPRRRRRWWIAGLAGALIVAGGLAVLLYMFSPRAGSETASLAGPVRLTEESGLNITPAISPDGKFVAYASDRAGGSNLDLWVRQIGSSEAVRLTSDAKDDESPNFSPDGAQIAFHSEKDGGGLYVIPTLGGPERRLADGGKDPKFSPDGTRIAYWTGPLDPYPLSRGRPQIFVVDVSTGVTRRLASDFAGAIYPVWAPDGKRILFAGIKDATDHTTYNWWMTSFDGTQTRSCGHMFSYSFAPEPKQWVGKRIYFTGDEELPTYLGQVEVDQQTCRPLSSPTRVRSGTTNEDSPSLARGGAMVFSSVNDFTDMYSLGSMERGRRRDELSAITHGADQDLAGSVSANGRILAFSSLESGNPEIWIRDLSTNHERELTFGGGRPRVAPLISPDGMLVAWREVSTGVPVLRITPVNGGPSRQLCSHCSKPEAWLPDSRHLLYESNGAGRSAIGLMDVQTGENGLYLSDPDGKASANGVTPDGKWLLFTVAESDRSFTTYAAPMRGDKAPESSTWVQVLRSPEADWNAVWADNGRLLVFSSSRDGFNCIWALRVDPVTKKRMGNPYPIHHFHAPSLLLAVPSANWGVALDSHEEVVSLQERTGSIWMLPGTK